MVDDEDVPEAKAPTDDEAREAEDAAKRPDEAQPPDPRSPRIGKVTPKPHVSE